MPKKNGKGRGRKSKGIMREMTVVDPEEKFADDIGQHQDSCNTQGKTLFSVILGSAAVTNAGVMNPTFFGTRVTNMAAIFTRWRINKLVFRIAFDSATTPSAAAFGVYGILDDASGAEGDAPTSADGLLALRVSGTVGFNTTAGTTRVYKPPDKDWRFCYAGATGSDPRLYAYGVLFVQQLGTASTSVYVQADYSITFKGATDIGATVTVEESNYIALPSNSLSVQGTPKNVGIVDLSKPLRR